MRRAITVLTFLAALAVPAAAQAGGWATVSLDPRPEGVQPGKPWVVNLTVKQHGQTPMTGIKPAVIVEAPDGKLERFDARATQEQGVYRAEVVFRKAGKFTYTVDDGFTNAFPVEYPPVQVGAPAAAAPPVTASAPPPDPGFPWTLYLGAVAVLALIGAGVAVATRSRA